MPTAQIRDQKRSGVSLQMADAKNVVRAANNTYSTQIADPAVLCGAVSLSGSGSESAESESSGFEVASTVESFIYCQMFRRNPLTMLRYQGGPSTRIN